MSRRRRKSGSGRPAAPPEQPEEKVEAGAPSEARRAQQIKEWEARKKEKERKQRRKQGGSPVPWVVGGTGLLAAVVAGGFLLLSGGGGSSESEEPLATPDARVAGLPVDQTVDIAADDDGQATNPRFDPNEVVGQAGEVIEFKLTNEGDVAHNLTVSGLDKEYGTRDDFTLQSLDAGESGTLLVKIDEPSVYPFRCDLHPQQQIGSLILN